MFPSASISKSSATYWPMMPEDGDPVSGFFRLARSIQRRSKPISDIELATWMQTFPAVIKTIDVPRSLVDKPVFVEGTITCRNGARFILTRSLRAVLAEDHVARFYLTKPEWVKNIGSLMALIDLYEELSTPYQRLVDEIFCDDAVLKRFVSAPASINGHHRHPGGLLDHTVDTARIVGRELASGETSCDPDTALTAAILHDLGKTLEYETSALSDGVEKYALSTRGVLVGHKLTGMDLITQAAARLRALPSTGSNVAPLLSDDQLSALIHAVTAAPAPDFVGVRSPITPEANLVAAADRMSADKHLFAMLSPETSSREPWGQAHWHVGRRRNRPFFVRQVAMARGA